MPRFEPFAGVRYDPSRVTLDDVTAPPYDVIDDEDQARLEAASPYNAVRVELSRDEPNRNRYESAKSALQEWLAQGVLLRDPEPGFYAVEMEYDDEAGRRRTTLGVVGALELQPPGTEILPHERTMPKPKGDRLNLLRACQANLSPIWGLSPASGLTELVRTDRPPAGECEDEEGHSHRVWRIDDAEDIARISKAVADGTVIIADGHHRYETALNYQQERRDAGAGAGPHDFLMTYVVELAEEQLSVRAIHRLVSDLPGDFDVAAGLRPFFELTPTESADEAITRRMTEAGALALITRDGAWLLTPRAEVQEAAEHDLDSSRLDVALAALPPHELVYQHGWDNVVQAVASGRAQAGFLLRPATVAQIAEVGRGGERMPPKTTFFHPKPRTGLVFRLL